MDRDGGMAVDILKDDATGMEKVVLREPGGATAEIHLHGGHVTSWKNKEGEELLFLSSKAVFKYPKPIYGGIQVCFPLFSGSGAPEQLHGYASSRTWKIDRNPLDPPRPPSSCTSASTAPSKPYVDLVFTPSEGELKFRRHNYSLHQRITLGSRGELTSDIRVMNFDKKPFTFTFALLNYLPVSDIEEVRIEGLSLLHFRDKLQKERLTEQSASFTFDSEVDRLYLGSPTEIAIINHDIHKTRTFVVKKKGLPDVAVWNPWDKSISVADAFSCGDIAKSVASLFCRQDDEYKHMLCVGSAAEGAIKLQPNHQWHARQEISIVPSSDYMGGLNPIKS